jgi:Zn-finger nucleic acid-binding protein
MLDSDAVEGAGTGRGPLRVVEMFQIRTGPIFFKSCPRCRGDLFLDRDKFGSYIQCLQCGFLRDLGAPDKMSEPAKKAPHGAPARAH